MLSSTERDRLKQGKPVSLLAIACAWAERRIEMGLASYMQVHALRDEMARKLRKAVRDGNLFLYHTTFDEELPYENSDEAEVAGGDAQLLPSSVDAWLDSEGKRPTLATPRIEPPDTWAAQSPHGLQLFDDSADGRLVRLVDLVLWLMSTNEMTCKNAVERICEPLEQNPSAAAGWLYLLTKCHFARPLPSDHPFFVRKSGEVGDGDKGLPGAIKYMRLHWDVRRVPDLLISSSSLRRSTRLDPLAIRLDVAYLLFGFGRRLDSTGQHTQASPPEPVETREERQDRRLQACIDAGLQMNERALLRMPDGVGKVAVQEGVTRQTFTDDVKAALRRKVERERPKSYLVKPS